MAPSCQPPCDRVDAFDQVRLAVDALLNGDVDAAIIDEVADQEYVGSDAEQVKLLEGDPLQSDLLGFAFPLGSDLVEPVNEALIQMTAGVGRSRFEFVEPPPEPVVGCGPVLDQGFPVVDNSSQLT